MNLASLIPINRTLITESEEESLLLEYTRKFSEAYGVQPLFKHIGNRDGVEVYTADLSDMGDMGLIVTEAKIMALVEKKQAMFGLIYTMTGLAVVDAVICKMKRKKMEYANSIELIKFDSEDKKNFDTKSTNFKKFIK